MLLDVLPNLVLLRVEIIQAFTTDCSSRDKVRNGDKRPDLVKNELREGKPQNGGNRQPKK